MTSWHSYPSVFALGHRYLAELLLDPVLVEEKLDGCVQLDTPILRDNLTWVPAYKLRVGDGLIGLTYRDNRLRLQHSIVTIATPIKKPCVEVITDKTKIYVSRDHPFWARRTVSNNPSKWIEAQYLTPGIEIPYIPVWNTDHSWESGYLAGQFDGEGALVKHGKHQRVLSYYQRVSPSQQFMRELLQEKGFTIREDYRKRQENYSEIWTAIIAGGWGEILRFLGTIRPQRLLEKSRTCWEGGAINGLDKAVVKSVSDIGDTMVMGLSTSTETYWAGGLASHNSQFSFGMFDISKEPINHIGDTVLRMRSKGAEINIIAPDNMFKKAVEYIQSIQGKLTVGWTYRGEYLVKPKHNALAYDRIPTNHIAIFDINIGMEEYLPYDQKRIEAERIGLEVVPQVYYGRVDNIELFRSFLDTTSMLGGQKIEGVVIKNYNRYGQDKKVLLGKFVSEAYKEVHAREWKASNPSKQDVVAALIESLKTPARWSKAVHHLRDAGILEDSPRDIGLLMKEIPLDIAKEETEYIKGKLFEWAWPQIRRGVTGGVPEWYKNYLLEKQFTQVE